MNSTLRLTYTTLARNAVQCLIMATVNLMLYLGLIQIRAMNTYGEVELELCAFLTLAR
jgi:hypothetical protein